ncbi:MAG: C4-dicarboxylate ABC transporter, partial [Pseudomonas sp.]|nr:C4-dicarboxylate ABC transporter [Pseudomonas sp.]
ATLRLGSMLHLSFFDVAGCILVLALALMWLLVGKRTVQGAYRGELFVSPCIAGLKK